jgi:hypothetical protein
LVPADDTLSPPARNWSTVRKSAFVIDLGQFAERCGSTYHSGEPYPHIVLDGMRCDETPDAVLRAWPCTNDVA